MIQEYTVRLTFQAPLLSQASGTLSFGYDTAMLRNDGKPVLGGSLIRGNIREMMLHFACELQRINFNKAEQITNHVLTWFGQPSSNNADINGFKPDAGKLQFDFYWTLNETSVTQQGQQRTRIAIDEYGKVKQGALQVIEDCFPLGTNPVFSGNIRAEFQDGQEAQQFERLMRMALDYIPAMGSFKGVGFGKLIKVEISPAKKQATSTTPVEVSQNRIGIEFCIDRPFCLGRPRTPESNRIVSSEIITGNVIKALLAKALSHDQMLNDLCFDSWYVSHCFPSPKEKQKRHYGVIPHDLCFDSWYVSHCLPLPKEKQKRHHGVIPLSIAKVGEIEKDNKKEGIYQDLYSVTLAEAMETTWESAPSFQIDWKYEDKEFIQKKIPCFQHYEPKRILQVRTGINSLTQTAQENQLFSMECVQPAGFVWRGDIDLSQVPKPMRTKAIKQLGKVLQQGLQGLGKTKAALTNITTITPPFIQSAQEQNIQLEADQQITLTLMTMARLFPLGWEHNKKQRCKTAEQLYQDYWQHVSGKGLQLVNFFAQQQREGGAYHYYHFQTKPKQKYAPEWLTVKGSVFVLQVKDVAKAQKRIKQWLQHGLPIPEEIHEDDKITRLQHGLPIPEGDKITWQHSPYLPEHGYGEVVLDWHPVKADCKEEEQSE